MLEQRLRHLHDRMGNLKVQILESSKRESIRETMLSIMEELGGQPRVDPQTQGPVPPAPVDVAGTVGESPALSAAFSGMMAFNYQQLPNPVAGIVKELPGGGRAGEGSPHEVYGGLFQLADFPGMVDSSVLQLVYP